MPAIARKLVLLVLVSLAVSGCGLAVGAGASVGVAAAQEGGLKRAARDARIQAEINDLWFKSNMDMFTKLDLTVNQGRVLITGIVQNPEARVEAVRLAWQPKGVSQVINEIRVDKPETFESYARDTWISTRLRAQLTFDRSVQSINYTIDTVQGTVYLMGTAQSQRELDRVIRVARTIPNVKQVVSYVKIRAPSQPAPAAASAGAKMPPADDTYNAQGGTGGQGIEGSEPVPLVPEPVESERLN